ncbi:STAS domain-containing protein [Pseudoxanthobacter sp.]|uniref:STAS domain-containing protein n=1 Tax=Pseudoxanthobacter sp. TaxID=1925742 RepID=UPI002FE0AB50
MTALSLAFDHVDSVLVASLTGRLDSTTAKELETALLERIAAGETRLVLDFARLDYISSAGLRVVLLAGKRTSAAGGRTALSGLGTSIRAVFEISGFIAIFPVSDTVAGGVAAVAG